MDRLESYFQGERTLKGDGSKIGVGDFYVVSHDWQELAAVDLVFDSMWASS